MPTTLTGVARQQGTTAAILIGRGQVDSGAIQLINTRNGKSATFRCVVVGLRLDQLQNYL